MKLELNLVTVQRSVVAMQFENITKRFEDFEISNGK